MLLSIPKGDKGFTLAITAKDSDGAIKDLTPYTGVVLKMWKPGIPGTLIIYGACTVTHADAGECSYTVPDTMTLTKGIYLAELELTATNIIESLDTFVVRIKESG